MTDPDISIMSDPHRLSWWLLIAMAFVGVVWFAVLKAMCLRRPRTKKRELYDIISKSDGSDTVQMSPAAISMASHDGEDGATVASTAPRPRHGDPK
jgi:hypothetical protein